MAGYREIIGGSWEQRSVFAESVPHLFHQDMTYLWVLEQQLDQRPKTWLARIDAWKLLLRLFFLDQLNPVTEELRKPLLDVAERFGIRRITWLRHKQSGQPLGVLSPTVVVRPLPDFVDAELERWRADLKDNDRDFRHLLHVAVRDLERAAGTSPFATRIADVLRREFSPSPTAQRPPGGQTIEVPLLNRLTWEKREGDASAVGAIHLAVRTDTGKQIPEYIPLCAACGQLLLQDQHAAAIDVGVAIVTIRCANPQCPEPQQELPLHLFGIWLRNASTAVVWTTEGLPLMRDLMLPPLPSPSGSELQYEWNATTVGEPYRRFLRLRFPARTIQMVPLMSIFFRRLLVPGTLATFNGSAVLPEWDDALDRSQTVEVAASDETQVEFRNLSVRGWPLTFSKSYQTQDLQREPEMAVGLFPNPSIVGPSWRWYRVFVHGGGSAGFDVSCSDGRSALASLASTDAGIPRWVTIRSRNDQSTGVAYLPPGCTEEEAYGGVTAAKMAIDFGTTNTLVYWQPPERQRRQQLVPRAETHGLDPRTIANHVLWLADSLSWRSADVLASFLPGPRFRPTATDKYIIPSEVWRVGREGFHLIRWGSDDPDGRGRPLSQFKWDSEDVSEEGFAPTRRAYLREIILQALPVIVAGFAPTRVTEVKIGFAFPLAFEHDARAQFRTLLDLVAAEISELTGLAVDMSPSINESKACVNAFGSFNGETFLVADMGGGTLDVALFSYDPGGTMRPHQMGSLRYAGERCVEILTTQLGSPDDALRLREAIARGESAKKYGRLAAERVVTRFVTIAFEFLRMMVAAYRAQEQERADETVHIVLIGNGWHLVEAFSSEVRVRGGKHVYHGIYADMVTVLGDSHLVFYDETPLSEFPSSKHLVVAGALQNVTAEATVDELSEDANTLAKLPAGRTMIVAGQTMPWYALVGEGARLPAGLSLDTAAEAKINVKITEMPVTPPDAWMTRLSHSVGTTTKDLPYPTQPELLRELRHGLVGSPPRLKRGPLQLVLELSWAAALSKKRGSVQ